MRTKPEIFLQSGTDNGKTATKVFASDGLFVILYKDKPFNLTNDRRGAGQAPVYLRTSYGNLTAANNLANRLNTLFDVDEFKVREIELV